MTFAVKSDWFPDGPSSGVPFRRIRTELPGKNASVLAILQEIEPEIAWSATSFVSFPCFAEFLKSLPTAGIPQSPLNDLHEHGVHPFL